MHLAGHRRRAAAAAGAAAVVVVGTYLPWGMCPLGVTSCSRMDQARPSTRRPPWGGVNPCTRMACTVGGHQLYLPRRSTDISALLHHMSSRPNSSGVLEDPGGRRRRLCDWLGSSLCRMVTQHRRVLLCSCPLRGQREEMQYFKYSHFRTREAGNRGEIFGFSPLGIIP